MLRNPKRFFEESGAEIDRGYALQLADKVLEKIKGQCRAFEICGSIRRQSDTVHDIDIVCMPRDWYNCSVKCISLADHVKIRTSPQLCRFVHNGVPVEIYFADNLPKYEMFKLMRTGSHSFNKLLMRAAFEYDLILKPYHGGLWFERQKDLYLVAWTEEQIICELLDEYVPPEERDKLEWGGTRYDNLPHPFK